MTGNMDGASTTNGGQDHRISQTDVPRQGVRRVFFGEDGLRGGWSALLFLFLWRVLQYPFLFSFILLGLYVTGFGMEGGTPQAVALSVLEDLFGVLAATLLMLCIERRPLSDYGLGRTHCIRWLVHGAVAGVGMMSMLVGLLFISGARVFDGVALQGMAAWQSGWAWAGAYWMLALCEELITRGVLLQALGRGLGFPWAAVLTSVLFLAGHLQNQNEGLLGLATVLLFGLVLSYSVLRFGSLWWAIGFHTTWNWAQSFLFGTANSGLASEERWLATRPVGPDWLSGGATGPEGSVWSALILVAMVVLIRLSSRNSAFSPGSRYGPASPVSATNRGKTCFVAAAASPPFSSPCSSSWASRHPPTLTPTRPT